MVDGAPLYLGAVYDPGTRVGRIRKRIATMTAGNTKLSVTDLQSIQADAVSEWAEALAPTLRDAATSLAAEIGTPGSRPELTALVAAASADAKKLVPTIVPFLTTWTFDTPSGAAEDNPTPQQIADSQATLVMGFWVSRYYRYALGDEKAKLGVDLGFGYDLKLLARANKHPDLLKSAIDPTTHDPVFFDDLTTPAIESKLQIAAKSLLVALDDIVKQVGADAAKWRWGDVHTLTLKFAVPFLQSLQIPNATDPVYPHGFPRHGFFGTVDVAALASDTDFSYSHGPAIRFVCDLDPATGPHAKNALPGGETFDPASPHFRDQIELWRKNTTYDLAFSNADVVKSAQAEYAKNHLGRIHITP
jgi:penicillin amidase